MSASAVGGTTFRIEDGTYGDATDTIRQIIASAERHRWFPPTILDERALATARDRVAHHFELLGDMVAVRSLSIDFVCGGWRVLAETYRVVNPAGDDPAYGRGRWRELLARIAGEMRRELEKSRQELIIPPLFPVVGNAGIVGGMLTTQIGGASVVNDDRYRQTVWYLMCDVDTDFWNAMIWPLAHKDRRESPFAELVDMYVAGFYPLGFIGERFIVYSYTQ